jgi:DNA-binding NarL/FixJ family response regulator
VSGVKLLLVDDHPLFVEGFAAMVARLRPGWRLKTAGAGAEAMAEIAGQAPDLVILDVFLPDVDGFDLVHRLKAGRPGLPVVLVSGRDHAAMAVRARASPADGFIPKTTPPPQFIGMLDAALSGRGAWIAAQATADTPVLTPRQAQVLELLAAGHGNKEIRYRLGIAERTVRAHLTELFQLLGVHGRMPAVIRARELGLIE